MVDRGGQRWAKVGLVRPGLTEGLRAVRDRSRALLWAEVVEWLQWCSVASPDVTARSSVSPIVSRVARYLPNWCSSHYPTCT